MMINSDKVLDAMQKSFEYGTDYGITMGMVEACDILIRLQQDLTNAKTEPPTLAAISYAISRLRSLHGMRQQNCNPIDDYTKLYQEAQEGLNGNGK